LAARLPRVYGHGKTLRAGNAVAASAHVVRLCRQRNFRAGGESERDGERKRGGMTNFMAASRQGLAASNLAAT
jgi:hypothetical protein